ncbi:lecithin retinol acyltransferase family protein [Helicobacter felis]|uniref:lecithin retinol acyltransferase family protein n=1 Tax=Helicobacter felis TaxID=214 RepID=UPI000EF6F004|nr:lecithin retinol acyltransferase family protein [Helicobacter felis]
MLPMLIITPLAGTLGLLAGKKAIELADEVVSEFYEHVISKYNIHKEDDWSNNDPIDGMPAVGSMVLHDLIGKKFSHSGVYIGGGKIIHLRKTGRIEPCDVQGFSGGKPIFVSCRGKKAVGDPEAAEYAKKHKGEKRKYNPLTNNCHGFTAECFTGNTQDEVRIKKPSDIGELLGMDCWRWWKYQ